MLASVALPALNQLRARGRAMPAGAEAPVASLSLRLGALFGLADFPLAPLRLQADGLDPGRGQWFCADPVHLLLMLDHLRLGAPPVIAQEEAAALA